MSIESGRGWNVALAAVLLMMVAGCGGGDAEDSAHVVNRGADRDQWWDALPRPEWQAFQQLPAPEYWFEVYRVSDGVYAIYEPGQFEEVISFLIAGTDRALLFDTGLGVGDIRAVVDGLTDLDVVVLNSHTHYDHIGGNYQFGTVYAADTQFTRNRALGSSREAVAGFLKEGWVWKPLPENFSRSEFRSRAFEIDRFVSDGEVIDLGGRQLEVLLTPGHTPDALCLLDRENRILFTGDTFYLAPLYTHLEGSDFEAYAHSASRLAGLSAVYDNAYTAHNVPVVDGRYIVAMDDAFAAIAAGTAEDYMPTDGNRQYLFEDFSIIVDPAAISP